MLFTHQFWLCVSVWQRTSISYALCCILQLWRHLQRSRECTASMVHHRELCGNYPALGIGQNNLLQLHILTILAIPKSCLRSPSCQLLLLSIPVGLHAQWIKPENLSQLSCGHHWWMCVADIYIYIAHVNITCEINWISEIWIMQTLNISSIASTKIEKDIKIAEFWKLYLELLIVSNLNVCLPIQMQDGEYVSFFNYFYFFYLYSIHTHSI